jgi:hypothetical protein
LGGIISEIMLVPLPRAASSRLISFFTFHISMFFSASTPCWSLILACVVGGSTREIESRGGDNRCEKGQTDDGEKGEKGA